MPRTKNPNTKTQWYSGKRQPDLPGVYEVEDQTTCTDTLVWFAYWNGKSFMCRGLTPDNAIWNNHLRSRYGQRPLRWRGLKHKPATHPATAADYNRHAVRA